jgi:hypothetical protein
VQNLDKDEVSRFMAGSGGHHLHGPSFVLLKLVGEWVCQNTLSVDRLG